MERKIIRVWALMRSGHHAILRWIFFNMNTPKIFFNNCRNKDVFHYVVINSINNVEKKFDLKKLNEFRNIIVNFEHPNLREWPTKNWGNLKKLGEITDLIVLRDPFNWVASSMSKKTFKQPVSIDMGLWKQQALEFLGITNYIPNGVPIKFNEWFSSHEYREEVAGKLGISNDETLINKLATRSSFDGRDFKDNAQDMKVLDRWQQFKKNERFLSYVDRKDIRDLSRKIFGFDPL